jgi:orotidine-5'-phosphate decarboxylase
MAHFADRLTEAIRAKGNFLCVGIDPRWDQLPVAIRRKYTGSTLAGVAEAFVEFGHRILDLVSPWAPVVKPQMAFFEMCGPPGLEALKSILRRARELDVITILDAKRGDIASTATAYADASFAGVTIDGVVHPVWDADALTVNPYLGRDAVEPFLQSARLAYRGVFVLVRTSNAGSGQFQNLLCDGRPLYQHVGEAVGEWGRENQGQCGLSDVGAVVGATHPAELLAIRKILPDTWFLVPGYGAQGGTVSDILPALRADGLGIVVNSSRGITFPFKPDDPNWESEVVMATKRAASELRLPRSE